MRNNFNARKTLTSRFLGAVITSLVMVFSANALSENTFVDVLDAPSVKMPKASKSLLLDIARAGDRLVAVG
ncbi:MAG: hypothetical protein KUG53_03295, partial [Pseudomonadales bacterium]|nr:hypothetical protein [Pseudomonadales bacterium]